jgi:hypothetical protein
MIDPDDPRLLDIERHVLKGIAARLQDDARRQCQDRPPAEMLGTRPYASRRLQQQGSEITVRKR